MKTLSLVKMSYDEAMQHLERRQSQLASGEKQADETWGEMLGKFKDNIGKSLSSGRDNIGKSLSSGVKNVRDNLDKVPHKPFVYGLTGAGLGLGAGAIQSMREDDPNWKRNLLYGGVAGGALGSGLGMMGTAIDAAPPTPDKPTGPTVGESWDRVMDGTKGYAPEGALAAKGVATGLAASKVNKMISKWFGEGYDPDLIPAYLQKNLNKLQKAPGIDMMRDFGVTADEVKNLSSADLLKKIKAGPLRRTVTGNKATMHRLAQWLGKNPEDFMSSNGPKRLRRYSRAGLLASLAFPALSYADQYFDDRIAQFAEPIR